MKIRTYGNIENEKILLLHPILMNGYKMYQIFKYEFKDYFIIAPDLSSQGDDIREFVSSEREALILRKYFKDKNISDIKLVFGMSLGSRVALDLIKESDINFDIIWLDGTPVYKETKMLYGFTYKMFEFFYKNAQKNKKFLMGKAIEKFGAENAYIMNKTLDNMSENSLKNIIYSCSHFDFPKYSEKLQRKIYFNYGGEEFDKKCVKTIKRKYPNVNLNIREGYKHCEYMLKDEENYLKEILKLM